MKVAKIVLALGITMLMAISLAHAVEIGPVPTSTMLNGNGSFAVSSSSISGASGFGGGTIYYPTTSGSYGVIAVCPGFTNSSSAISWFASRLATYGFVTVAMNTNSVFDFPDSRATQLAAALKYVVNSSSSTIRSRIRSADRGVSGYSMGGGGTLLASKADSTLKVGVSMAPWNQSTDFSAVRVPQMIFGGSSDSIAPVSSMASPFYNSIPSTVKKALAVLNGATHFTPTSTDERIGRYGVAFAKRFVDQDTRYTTFLCGAEHTAYATSSRFTQYTSNCPY
jgi:dienelactone hydrolase